MTKQITRKELLDLVSVEQNSYGDWNIDDVYGNVHGDIEGDVIGTVYGNVGNVGGTVFGRINEKKWQFSETPEDKLRRLIEEGADKGQLLEALNQLEDN